MRHVIAVEGLTEEIAIDSLVDAIAKEPSLPELIRGDVFNGIKESLVLGQGPYLLVPLDSGRTDVTAEVKRPDWEDLGQNLATEVKGGSYAALPDPAPGEPRRLVGLYVCREIRPGFQEAARRARGRVRVTSIQRVSCYDLDLPR